MHHPLEIPVLVIVSFVSSYVPPAVGWIRWRFLSKEMRLLLGLFTLYIPFSVANLFLNRHGINSVWMSQCYSLAEYVVYAVVFSSWAKDEKVRSSIKGSIYFYVGFWIIAKLSFEPITLFDTFTGPIRELLLAAMGVYTMLTLVGEENVPILRHFRFWIAVAVLIYSVGTLPMFAIANKLLAHSLERFATVWTINWTLIIIANVFYAIAFLSVQRAKLQTVSTEE